MTLQNFRQRQRPCRLAFGIALTLSSSTGVLAQTPASPNDSSACTYDTCALRLQGQRLLRGTSGSRVLTLGPWRASSLRPHVAWSDSASYHAAIFDRHYTAGTRLTTIGLLGTGVMGLLYGEHLRGGEDWSDATFIAHAAASALFLGLLEYGSRRLARAHGGLSRAVWWFNRDLPR